MYPTIVTSSFQFNAQYFSKLLTLLTLDDEEFKASFDFKKPESLNDFLQLQSLIGLIDIGIVELEEAPNGTMVKVKSEFFNPPC
ncbi:hypothetical protein HOO68_04735 [Candidatus Gracilibacteria bacterium]|nr:hypothetical protein [Candidatus Gracilibacteria bacterium]